MSANVGLSTPRGSGTSGYVQRNLSLLRPRDNNFTSPLQQDYRRPTQRKPDQNILDHDRRRDVEVKVLELRDRLEDEGKLDDEEIDEECEKLRAKLLKELETRGSRGVDGKGLKMHQVHELAEVKLRESDRLRRALGLKETEVDNEQQQGEHPMARQERRKQEEAMRREREELERLERIKEREKLEQEDRVESEVLKEKDREKETE